MHKNKQNWHFVHGDCTSRTFCHCSRVMDILNSTITAVSLPTFLFRLFSSKLKKLCEFVMQKIWSFICGYCSWMLMLCHIWGYCFSSGLRDYCWNEELNLCSNRQNIVLLSVKFPTREHRLSLFDCTTYTPVKCYS